MKKFTLCFFCIAILVLSVASQNVGIGTTTPNASALLDINSSNKGILIPRLTTVQRDAISFPAEGLMIYNTTDSTFYVYKARWRKMGITLPYTDTVAHNQYGVNIVNTGGGTALRGTATTNFTTAVSGTSASFGIGVSGSSVDGGSGVSGQSSGNGSGVAGSNADANGNGVYGQSSGSGTGVYGTSFLGTGGRFNSTFGNALVTTGPVKMNGSIQLQGMGEATGRILQSDANGNASWGDINRLYQIAIPAIAFHPANHDGYLSFFDEGEVVGRSSNSSYKPIISAAIIIPNGATITNLFFYVRDVHNNIQLNGQLVVHPHGTNSYVQSAIVGSGHSFDGGYTSFNIPINQVVNTALNSYVIKVYATLPNNSLTFWGTSNDLSLETVIVTYTMKVN